MKSKPTLFYLMMEVEATIKKLEAHDASWSRIQASKLQRALTCFVRDKKKTVDTEEAHAALEEQAGKIQW